VCTVHHVRILAGFMHSLGHELKIGDVIESCHIPETSENGAEFRETTPIREINGTKNQKVLPRGCHQVGFDLARLPWTGSAPAGAMKTQ
jgi:hypothetical protein